MTPCLQRIQWYKKHNYRLTFLKVIRKLPQVTTGAGKICGHLKIWSLLMVRDNSKGSAKYCMKESQDLYVNHLQTMAGRN